MENPNKRLAVLGALVILAALYLSMAVVGWGVYGAYDLAVEWLIYSVTLSTGALLIFLWIVWDAMTEIYNI